MWRPLVRRAVARRIDLAVGVVAALPVVVWSARRLAEGGPLIGDAAIFDLRVRDVFSTHPPLVGLYSRFGWNHPGPIAFYWAAPFRLITGGNVGSITAAAAWSIAALALTIGLARRRGGTPTVLAAVLALALVWVSTGGAATTYMWPPYLAASLLVPFVIAVWGGALGDAVAIVWAVVLGSTIVQVHIGSGFVVVVPAVIAAIVVWRTRRISARGVRRLVVITVGLWSPVVLDTLLHWPGNLRRVASFFTSSNPRAVGWDTGIRMLSAELRPWPDWIGGPARAVGFVTTARTASPAWLATVPVVLVAACVAARRTKIVSDAFLLLVAAGLVAAAAVAGAQVRGTPFLYLVLWRSAAVVLVFLAAAIAIGHALPMRHRVRGAIVGGLAVAIVVAVAVAANTRADTDAVRGGEKQVHTLTALAEHRVAPGERILMRFDGADFGGILPGVFHAMTDHGYHVALDRDLAYIVGDTRTASPRATSTVWYFTESSIAAALYATQPGAHVVASVSGLDAADLARLFDLQATFAAQLRAEGETRLVSTLSTPLVAFALAREPGLDRGALGRLGSLNARVARSPFTAIIAFPPDRLPHPWWPAADSS